LIDRPGLPASLRAAIAAATTAEVAASLEMTDGRRAERIARNAREQAFVAIAVDGGEDDLVELVQWLRQGEHLTAALLMRALVGGDLSLLRHSLAEMAGAPMRRVEGLLRDPGGAGFAAIYSKAGLPAHLFPAFRIAARYAGEAVGHSLGVDHSVAMKTIRAVEALKDDAMAPALALLWRLAGEGVREEAREFAAATAETVETGEFVLDEPPAAPPVLLLNLEAGNENAAPPIALEATADGKAAA
jgi:uncharacterized protein (DUF2336 family)